MKALPLIREGESCFREKMDIEKFIAELREPADVIHAVFTRGSCFRLYKMIKVILPGAEAYWSDMENHCITEIAGKFYNIGGRVDPKYMHDKGYYKIPKKLEKGYALLKYKEGEEKHTTINVEKYI